VPRWIPVFYRRDRKDRREEDSFEKDFSKQQAFSWRATLFSERGTFAAMAVGYLLLWIKARF
jgi:hypothetical protein